IPAYPPILRKLFSLVCWRLRVLLPGMAKSILSDSAWSSSRFSGAGHIASAPGNATPLLDYARRLPFDGGDNPRSTTPGVSIGRILQSAATGIRTQMFAPASSGLKTAL